MFQLTGFQRDLLYVLVKLDRPSGQDVMAQISEERNEEVNHGRLYPNLDTLVERGLVEKGQIDRRTNYYELTEEGRRALEERRQWENEHVPQEL
ncbi:MAG: PadR family transcriptional regulator [Salinigranum sp.]